MFDDKKQYSTKRKKYFSFTVVLVLGFFLLIMIAKVSGESTSRSAVIRVFLQGSNRNSSIRLVENPNSFENNKTPPDTFLSSYSRTDSTPDLNQGHESKSSYYESSQGVRHLVALRSVRLKAFGKTRPARYSTTRSGRAPTRRIHRKLQYENTTLAVDSSFEATEHPGQLQITAQERNEGDQAEFQQNSSTLLQRMISRTCLISLS